MKVIHREMVCNAQQYRAKGPLPVGAVVKGTHGTGIYVMSRPPRLLHDGDWVVVDSFGNVNSYTEKEFKRLFVEVA
jgi:hypothetical protein